jgi:hypothetical protein
MSLHRSNAVQLKLATEARAAAWNAARVGCRRNLGLTREVAKLVTREIPAKPHTVVTGEAGLTVEGDPALIRRGSGSTDPVVVPCNERVALSPSVLGEIDQALAHELLPSL